MYREELVGCQQMTGSMTMTTVSVYDKFNSNYDKLSQLYECIDPDRAGASIKASS